MIEEENFMFEQSSCLLSFDRLKLTKGQNKPFWGGYRRG
jgi:hypothetical protein